MSAIPVERPLGRGGLVALVALLVIGTWLATAEPFTFATFLAYGLVGGVLIARRPANAIGWITLAIAFGFIGTTVPNLSVEALQAGTAPTHEFMLVWVGSWVGSASYVLFLALAILFPSGHLPRGRWWWPAAMAIAAAAMLTVLTAIAPTINYMLPGDLANAPIPNRLAVLPSLPIWSLIPTDGSLILPILALLGVAVGALVVRYRRTTGVARLQLRWLVSALVFCIAALAFGLGTLALFGDEAGGFGWLPAGVAFPTVPLAIGVAVTRYRLFEIDRIVSRTIAYAAISAILAFVFAGLVLALQAILAPLTQGNTLAVAVSTLVVFALFEPVRGRVKVGVDRRFHRAKVDGERAAAAFADRLRNQLDLPSVVGDLEVTADATVQPRALAVWLRAAGSVR